MSHSQACSPFDLGVSELISRMQCRPVTGEDFDEVCKLRYEAYRREGALPANAPYPYRDRFDDMPNATTYAFTIEGQLVASIRIHVATRECPEHPALQAFPDFSWPLIEAGETLVDPTRFVVDYDASRLYPKIPYTVLRVAFMAGTWFDADKVYATVRTEHQAFYRRYTGHRVACPARPYPSLAKPVSLMVLDHRADRDRLVARHPYFYLSPEEGAALYGGRAIQDHYVPLVA